MIKSGDTFKRSYKNAIGRWAGVGPYYAMFPIEFAFEVVDKFSESGGSILDPFAGRASSIYAAATQKRSGLGIEINPVGWLYGKVKLEPANKTLVEKRLKYIADEAANYSDLANNLPEFYHVCYSRNVLKFLLAARSLLDWKNNKVDTTLMSIILIHLHAKLGSGLSNQMRQSKAMAPDYSIRWWRERNMEPPKIDPYEFLLKKLRWRYVKGIPDITESEVLLGDSIDLMKNVIQDVQNGTWKPFSLLFTSPPYCGITHYHYDQWLRLWMLGGPELPEKKEEDNKGRFSSKEKYRTLLETIFKDTAQVMSEDSTIYVRTDAREFTFDTTLEVLKESFPKHNERIINRPVNGQTQTALFGDKSQKPGEVDILLTTVN